MFEHQPTFYKNDQVCYTFNKNGNYTGKSLDRLKGFNFVVNFNLPGYPGSPGLEFSKPTLIVHPFNEVPDMSNFPALAYKIKAGPPMFVGVDSLITNVTSNFAKMPTSLSFCNSLQFITIAINYSDRYKI